MSHSTSRKGVASAAAPPMGSKAIAVISSNTQPIPSLLKVVASDAATASIRRSMMRFSIKGLDVSEDSDKISVATWSRRDVTRFTRGIMLFSRYVQLARLTSLCRAVWSWRDKVSGQTDPQGNTGGDGEAGLPPAVVASDRGLSGSSWDQTERRESLSLNLTIAQTRLNTVYLREMHRNESLRQSLGAARQSLAVAQATPSSSEHTKRYLLLHITAGLRRRLRNGFSQWKAFACRAQDAQRLNRLELQLSLGAQTVLSRERLVLEKAQANVDLTWLMKRASCFYTWKMSAVQGKIDDCRAFHADKRASIARSVRELRELELSHLSAESRVLKAAESAGLELSEALRRLQAVAVGGVSKSLSRLT